MSAIRVEHLWVSLDTRVNTTRRKEGLLAQLLGPQAGSIGQYVLFAFGEDIGKAPGKAYEQDFDRELVHLSWAPQIVRLYMFEEAN